MSDRHFKAMVLREQLAAIEHERWADWQRWVHDRGTRHDDGSITLSAADVARWERQVATDYDDLSETEKQSDREQVLRYWDLIEPYLLGRRGVPAPEPAPAGEEESTR